MELTSEQLQLRLKLLRAMDQTNEVLAKGLIYLRQAYEVMNYFGEILARRDPMISISNNIWDGLFTVASHRITDLFDDGDNVVSIRRVLGMIDHNAKTLSEISGLSRKVIKSRVAEDRKWLKRMQVSKAFKPFLIHRNKVSAHTDVRGLPEGTDGRGFTTGSGRVLLTEAFDLLERWRRDLGLPVVINPIPEGAADTKVLFHVLDKGLSACFGQPVIKGWFYGGQDWREAWMEPAVPTPHDCFDAYEEAPSVPSEEAASGSDEPPRA